MAESRGGFRPTAEQAQRCYAQWRAGVPCPNDGEWVVENLLQPGYGKFCGPHMDGYRRFNLHGEGVSWRASTRAEWEASGRAAEHDAAINGLHGRCAGTPNRPESPLTAPPATQPHHACAKEAE